MLNLGLNTFINTNPQCYVFPWSSQPTLKT